MVLQSLATLAGGTVEFHAFSLTTQVFGTLPYHAPTHSHRNSKAVRDLFSYMREQKILFLSGGNNYIYHILTHSGMKYYHSSRTLQIWLATLFPSVRCKRFPLALTFSIVVLVFSMFSNK